MNTTFKPIVSLASAITEGPVTAETLAKCQESSAYRDLFAFFDGWPEDSFMTIHSRCVLYTLIRMMRPKVVAEVGTLFAGTTQVLARALWENGVGEVHTTDPFGAERCPAIIAAWPPELRAVTRYYPLNSMDFFLKVDQQRLMLDLVLVDGNHDYEFALFDLQMAARLLRPGGIVVMDNAEQSGPYQASRTFLQRHTAWSEIGTAVKGYDPLNPFDVTRTSIPGTTFILLKSPSHVSVGSEPCSWGQVFTDVGSMQGLTLDLTEQVTSGTLCYHVIFRGFGDGNRAGVELKEVGRVRVDADGSGGSFTHKLQKPLSWALAANYPDVRYSYEIEMSWQPDPGATPLALRRPPIAD